jgi:hypothetical protein
MASMKSPIAIVPALIGAAAVITTAVVYLNHSHDGGADNKDNSKQVTLTANHGSERIVATPEPNAGIVLIPFVGAVLAFSTLKHFRAQKAAQNGV